MNNLHVFSFRALFKIGDAYALKILCTICLTLCRVCSSEVCYAHLCTILWQQIDKSKIQALKSLKLYLIATETQKQNLPCTKVITEICNLVLLISSSIYGLKCPASNDSFLGVSSLTTNPIVIYTHCPWYQWHPTVYFNQSAEPGVYYFNWEMTSHFQFSLVFSSIFINGSIKKLRLWAHLGCCHMLRRSLWQINAYWKIV
jgi:hypothetical protein